MGDQKLKDYFKFDEGDLQANRDGNLSEKQKMILLKRRKDFKNNGIKYASICVAIGLGIIVIDWGISVARQAPHADSGALITAGVVILLGFLMLLLTLTSESAKTDISKDMVKKAQGPVNILKADRTRNDSSGHIAHYFAYELHIGGKAFDVDENLADVIMQNDECAVYYDDFNGKILSVEFLSRAG
jgi:hypothetical protein